MTVSAIIVAAGQGRRLGANLPKQLLDLGGRPIVEHSLSAFEASERVEEIVLVFPPELVQSPPDFVRQRPKPLHLAVGGARRQDSVAAGFSRVRAEADVIVIHDAARPFVTPALIARTIDAAADRGAAVAAIGAIDTVKHAAREGTDLLVDSTLPRDAIFLAQTPQAFQRSVLERALAFAQEHGVEATDEAAIVERMGQPVVLVEGEPRNIKITTADDLELARRFVAADSTVARVGTGYDLHRLVEGRRLVVGGVEIDSPVGALGHSDGDVICHAATDAILGAAAAGDIGRHFSDTDARWKDASSLELLRQAATLTRAAGFIVENLDVVVVLERPKIAAFIDAMRGNLAAALGVDAGRISVKGKTNEGVDAVGRGEAIAAHAVALLRHVARST